MKQPDMSIRAKSSIVDLIEKFNFPDKKLRIAKVGTPPLNWELIKIFHAVEDIDSKNNVSVFGKNKFDYTDTLDLENKNTILSKNNYDYIVGLKNIPNIEPADYNKLILFQTEPPLASNIRKTYELSDKFHAFFCFYPQNKNHLEITADPSCFPYKPTPKLYNFISNPPQSSDRFTIYYAGKKGEAICKVPDIHGSINIYSMRDALVSDLLFSELGNVYGKGWSQLYATISATQLNHTDGFRVQKQKEIKENNSRFVLAVENSILKNYISEKIHDGFASDRVTLYLGAPNIDEFVPTNCFVDLRRYFDHEKKHIVSQKLISDLKKITDHEYRKIQSAARLFRVLSSSKTNSILNKTTIKFLNCLQTQ